MTKLHDLRSYLEVLKKEHQLLVIDDEVDPYLEIAEIHRRIIAKEDLPCCSPTSKVQIFRSPPISSAPTSDWSLHLAANRSNLSETSSGSPSRSCRFRLAKYGTAGGLFLDGLKIGLKNQKKGPVLENCQMPAKLSSLPMLTSWHSDGGAFVTLPLVYTEHPDGLGHNLGMYRIQRYDDTTTGIHWQIHKGGGFHYFAAEKKTSPCR